MKTNSSNSANAFSRVTKSTTFGELKRLLPGTGTGRVPGIKKLRETAVVVLQCKTNSGNIEVFDNGFYIFAESGNVTVYAVDRCSALTWRFCTDEKSTSEGEDLDKLPWTMPLEIAGANRIEDSHSVTERRHQMMYLDDPASTNNILFSVRPEHEINDEKAGEEEYRMKQILLMQKAMKELTPKQNEILILVYLKGMSQAEAAVALGVSRRTVREQLSAAEKKIKKFFKNTRLFTL